MKRKALLMIMIASATAWVASSCNRGGGNAGEKENVALPVATAVCDGVTSLEIDSVTTLVTLRDNASPKTQPNSLFYGKDRKDSVKVERLSPSGEVATTIHAFLVKKDNKLVLFDTGVGSENGGMMLARLDSLCPAGSRLPDLKVPVTIVRTGKSREIAQTKKLSALRNSAVIFHTEGCPVCRSEIQSARSMLSSGKITIERIPRDEDSGHVSMRTAVLVDMDRIWSTDPELAEELMGEFDLSSLPFILCTDSKGKVTRKYISLARLQTDTNTYDENSIL